MRALAYVLLVAVSGSFVMVSDLFIRTQKIPGTDPGGWDAFGTIGMLLGVFLLVQDYRRSPDKPQGPTTRSSAWKITDLGGSPTRNQRTGF